MLIANLVKHPADIFVESLKEEKAKRADLLPFLKAWLAWAEAPTQDSTFSTKMGLCSYAEPYGRYKLKVTGLKAVLKAELAKDFPDELHCPFNKGRTGETRWKDYSKESAKCIAHKNPKRLAWVRKTIKELEDAQRISD